MSSPVQDEAENSIVWILLKACNIETEITPVCPEYNVIFLRIPTTLEEVEEQVSTTNVNKACVSAERKGQTVNYVHY